MKAMIKQAKKITLTSRAFRNDQFPFFYKELSEFTGYEMSLPMNSAGRSRETALKLARKWAYQVKKIKRYKAEIIVADGNFHGRTISIISFSSEPLYKNDFGPFTPGFINVAYGDAKALEKAIIAEYSSNYARTDPGRRRCHRSTYWISQKGTVICATKRKFFS